MKKDDKDVIANEVEKYFLIRRINRSWFSQHLDPLVELPDDGFEPHNMTDIKIDKESIKGLGKDLYVFNGRSTVLFKDKASGVGSDAEVEFGGEAYTSTGEGRTLVDEILLTSFHRTTDLLPTK